MQYITVHGLRAALQNRDWLVALCTEHEVHNGTEFRVKS